MSHMVIFRSSEGKAGYHQADSLDDAIRFVERIRNQEGVEQARIFRMEEVGFEFRPYFRVEVAGPAAAPAATPVAAAPAPSPDAAPEPAEAPASEAPAEVEEPVEVGVGADGPADGNGRRGLFGR